VTRVESAREHAHRVEAALPGRYRDLAAAVADWRLAQEGEQKLKKTSASMPPAATGRESNPGNGAKRKRNRPPLVIGFAAERRL